MSDSETDTTTSPPPPATEPTAARRSWARDVLLVVGVVVLGGALGAAGGWLWYEWWGPPHDGRVYDVPGSGATWFPDPWDPGQAHVFAATAQFVVVGVVAGLVLGVVAGLLGRNRALAALAGVVVAAALGAFVASRVGFAMSPPDPQSLVDAGKAQVDDRLPAEITLSGWTPYLSWPIGALVGFLGVMLSSSSIKSVRRREQDPTTWLGRPSA